MAGVRKKMKSKLFFVAIAAAVMLLLSSFFPYVPQPAPQGHCAGVEGFRGYTFLDPGIINKTAAYAPFFIRWDRYYERYFFNKDIQREENIEEWIGRFCDQPTPAQVEYVVYKASMNELAQLRDAAADAAKRTLLPYTMEGNTLAEIIALSSCTEAADYLIFTRKCEPYVLPSGDGWQLPPRDQESMELLVEEGLTRFDNTQSHFYRLRYAYQIIRLAHYAGKWQQTVDLYNRLIPRVDRKKPSIVFYWTLGHLAGALQRLGRYPEAAYRYALIFRHCVSKRAQAYRSFYIRNDQDWKATLALCENDEERATLYTMRAGGAHTYAVDDMRQIYELDPGNPQLELLLVGDIQELEKLYLRTPVTDAKRGKAVAAIQRQQAARHLIDLQELVKKVLRDRKTPNPRLWEALGGYLELLAGDRYAAEKTFDRVQNRLGRSDDYEIQLYQQIETWRILLEIMNLSPETNFPDDAAFRIRSYAGFKENPHFEPFLQDWLSAAYAASRHPGKALLAAYEPAALTYNPQLDELEDLLKLAASDNPLFLEKVMKFDSNMEQVRARLLEIKGVYLYSIGQPQAALSIFRSIPSTQQLQMTKFSPFREMTDERVHRPVTDTLLLNRRQILERIIDYDFKAQAAAAVQAPVAAWYYYLNGLACYNMSYFGYEWEAMDYYRSGYNWLRLAQGPIYPLQGSPAGNRENIDLSLSLSYFEKALAEAKNPELAARAAFMAARCQQKMWFCAPECKYKPGSRLIPELPESYVTFYQILGTRYAGTEFYAQMVKECKWLAAYMR
jgi:hypothetical protein